MPEDHLGEALFALETDSGALARCETISPPER
jgi:hypothetical protein